MKFCLLILKDIKDIYLLVLSFLLYYNRGTYMEEILFKELPYEFNRLV